VIHKPNGALVLLGMLVLKELMASMYASLMAMIML